MASDRARDPSLAHAAAFSPHIVNLAVPRLKFVGSRLPRQALPAAAAELDLAVHARAVILAPPRSPTLPPPLPSYREDTPLQDGTSRQLRILCLLVLDQGSGRGSRLL